MNADAAYAIWRACYDGYEPGSTACPEAVTTTRATLRLAVDLAPWWFLRGRLAGQYPLLSELVDTANPSSADPGSPEWSVIHFWLGLYPAAPGYDLATGIGTPRMAALITGILSESTPRAAREPKSRGQPVVPRATAAPDAAPKLWALAQECVSLPPYDGDRAKPGRDSVAA